MLIDVTRGKTSVLDRSEIACANFTLYHFGRPLTVCYLSWIHSCQCQCQARIRRRKLDVSCICCTTCACLWQMNLDSTLDGRFVCGCDFGTGVTWFLLDTLAVRSGSVVNAAYKYLHLLDLMICKIQVKSLNLNAFFFIKRYTFRPGNVK